MASQQSSSQNPSSPNIDVTSPYMPRRPSPIVSISLNNPIGSAFRKIKNFLIHKQTLFATSFTIKVIPIVAIVSLLGVVTVFSGGITTAYNFDKTVEQKFLASSPTPTPKVVVQTSVITTQSKTGIIKATYQLPLTTPIPTANATNSATTPTPQPILHYILVSRSGTITYLSSQTVTLQKYLNLRVLITGSMNSTTNTISVAKSSDIEILQ